MTLYSQSGITDKLCKNCDTPLADQNFCPQCGQKSDTHILSFRELLEEFADGLFNLDSRVWRSLLPLVLHPGKLTIEYLAGKRLRYLPPFRLYLILSLLFFVIPNDYLTLPDNSGQGDSQQVNATDIPDTNPEQLGDQELAREEDNISNDSCRLAGMDQDALFTALIRNTCLMINEDSERFLEQLEDTIPIMMLIGLPLVALIMQLFYLFSGRYYVEHVIFLFHVHAFYFLISILMSVTSLLGQAYGIFFTPMNWFRILASFYIPVYIFIALKNVYGQSATKTLFKAFFLLFGYSICISLVMAFGALFTAMTL